MFERWFSSLAVRAKILATVIATMVLAVTLSGAAFIAYDLQQQKSALLDNFAAIAQVTAQRSSAAVAFMDAKRARENLAAYALVRGATAACLFSHARNRPLASWPEEPLVQPHYCATEPSNAGQVQYVSDEFVLAVPVTAMGNQVGVLTVYGSFAPLYARSRQLAMSLLLISAAASLVAYVATLPLQQRIYQPIVHLGEVARHVGQHNDFTVRATKAAPDELGDTVDAFNAMLNSLADDKKALEKMAYFDALTGLPNRRKFIEELARTIAHSRIHKTLFGLIFIDLDNFKWVNDNLGHDRGDELLKEFSRRVAGTVREDDSVCRLGGDEFTVILRELKDDAEGGRVCERILTALAPPMQLGQHQHTAGASLGLAVSDGYKENVDSIIKKADLAVYDAKSAGKNTFRLYHPGLQ
ncbi:diguanylate cyclase [Simiduia sp. 21SJ11W-1]|uniref:sensor domain-containing diguanylate cyclase n=1 Tax=Simiduia sp. 21SJ11W-1 TaxID=2909669 RepID=UPI0020A205DA|nr:sensor domain-containing diguanylate cyclase [Simiduia sp. 21SJ11W-1]UTA46784.1 diguanylate cyclase [Simiduia sp. 21SJ11W-1]